MLYIRADGNSEIGLGHVMRCLSIAKASKARGYESTFITADKNPQTVIEQSGFPVICLNSSWNNLDDEKSSMVNLIRKMNIEKILIDSYFVTESYLSSIREYTKVIYLDDLNQFVYPVDLLINYNIYAKQFNYVQEYKVTGTKLLLGCEFAPLREDFMGRIPTVRPKVMDVLVTTGGSDFLNTAGNLIEYLFSKKQYSNIKFHIVTGNLNPNKEYLYQAAEHYSNIIIHCNVTEMAKLMSECDFAISAGGSTLYELCACGIPAISFSFADNQLPGVAEFHNRGIIYYSGDVRNDRNSSFNHMEMKMLQLIADFDLRRKLSSDMQKLVDGLGAGRIVEQINIL